MIISDYRLVRNTFPKRSWWQRYYDRYSNKQVLFGRRETLYNITSRNKTITIRGSIFGRYISAGLMNFNVKDFWGKSLFIRSDLGFVEFILKSKTIIKI